MRRQGMASEMVSRITYGSPQFLSFASSKMFATNERRNDHYSKKKQDEIRIPCSNWQVRTLHDWIYLIDFKPNSHILIRSRNHDRHHENQKCEPRSPMSKEAVALRKPGGPLPCGCQPH